MHSNAPQDQELKSFSNFNEIKDINNSEIKKQLHHYIDMIEDESQLQMLNEAAEVYATKNQTDILDLLTSEQLKRLERAIQQAEEGKVIPHEEVLKLSKQWLTNNLVRNCLRRLPCDN